MVLSLIIYKLQPRRRSRAETLATATPLWEVSPLAWQLAQCRGSVLWEGDNHYFPHPSHSRPSSPTHPPPILFHAHPPTTPPLVYNRSIFTATVHFSNALILPSVVAADCQRLASARNGPTRFLFDQRFYTRMRVEEVRKAGGFCWCL